MRGSLRFALTVLSLVVLVAVAGCAGTSRTPAALVGRWKGGSHTNGPWCYEFAADGTYRAWPARVSRHSTCACAPSSVPQDPCSDPGPINEGTVVVVGAQITFSNGGAPVTMTWSTADRELVLDGQRYVRI